MAMQNRQAQKKQNKKAKKMLKFVCATCSCASSTRPPEPNRRCRNPIAKVKWDPEFKMIDSYVPLNDALYAKENRHCGWNLIKDEFLEFICTKIAECDRAGAGAGAAAKK